MKIIFNTDKTVDGDDRHKEFFTNQIATELDRFSDHLTRIEVHLSDKNGKKVGRNDIQCLLEARLEGKQPIAVTSIGNTNEQAVSGAIDKMRASLETILGKIKNY